MMLLIELVLVHVLERQLRNSHIWAIIRPIEPHHIKVEVWP